MPAWFFECWPMTANRRPTTSWLAPTLIRSQVLERLYQAVRGGELPEDVGRERLARFSQMKIRFLGDAVLRRKAWKVAEDLGWESTNDAEYVALTQLQADALVTLDNDLARGSEGVVELVSLDQLLSG
jgi:indolepyruvate ferredoxin oxidoreductase alpha subunit